MECTIVYVEAVTFMECFVTIVTVNGSVTAEQSVAVMANDFAVVVSVTAPWVIVVFTFIADKCVVF